jgi:hypothetical protein
MKKRVIGIIGAAFVFATTAFAVQFPAPQVSAADDITVAFTVLPAELDLEVIDNGAGVPSTTLKGNCIARVHFDPGVKKIIVTLEDTPIEVAVLLSPAESAQGFYDVSLPVADEGISNGPYRLTVASYVDPETEVFETYFINVLVDIPDVPKTGVFGFLGGSASEIQFFSATIVTLIVAVFFFVIIRRRNDDREKRPAINS